MAIVASRRHANDWLIDDKILVEHHGRTIRLRDYATGQVIENGGQPGNELSLTGAGFMLTDAEWATYETTYGDAAAAVAKGRYLIDSGKFLTHQADAGSGAWTKFGGAI